MRDDSVKRIIVALFLCLLFSVSVLGFAKAFTGAKVDVELKGYTDAVERPAFSMASFSTGEFQRGITSWWESVMPLKGVLTKTYATLRYKLFSLGNRPIGKNGDIFDCSIDYIEAELKLLPIYDYSAEENRLKMEQFVETLVSVQEKLQRHGKFLYVYIAPNKANFNPENIPDKYKNMADEKSIRVVDAFRDAISQTDVPYLICADMKDELEYPAFYTTGIHWSRTFEQKASERIISELSDITGNQYQNIILGDVRDSNEPFWRDADVYDLLNVWGKPNVTYYEYQVSAESLEEYTPMRFLIQGDSFAEGLRKDILDTYPFEDIFYINYDNYIMEPNGAPTELYHSWGNLDLNYYLRSSDVVVIEIVEPGLVNYTQGFVDHLNVFLDSYEGDSEIVYPEKVDAAPDAEWPIRNTKGIYGKEENFAWAKERSQVIITDPGIAENGLELSIAVPAYLLEKEDAVTISVYINGKKLHEDTHAEPWDGSIIISGEEIKQLKEPSDTYRIEIRSSAYFVPKELGLGDDLRDLAIQVRYIGEVR